MVLHEVDRVGTQEVHAFPLRQRPELVPHVVGEARPVLSFRHLEEFLLVWCDAGQFRPVTHAHQHHPFAFVGQQHVGSESFLVADAMRVGSEQGSTSGAANREDFEVVALGVDEVVVHRELNGIAGAVYHTLAGFHQISKETQLCGRTLLEGGRVEVKGGIARNCADSDERAFPQHFMIPIIDECFEAEIAEHHHMSSLNQDAYNAEKCLPLIVEVLALVSAAALPVEHHALRLHLLHLLHQATEGTGLLLLKGGVVIVES